jgi:hypothetical protein
MLSGAARFDATGDPGRSPDSAAVLRVSAGARLIAEAWSFGQSAGRRGVRCQLAGVGAIVAGLERRLADRDDLNSVELCHGN